MFKILKVEVGKHSLLITKRIDINIKELYQHLRCECPLYISFYVVLLSKHNCCQRILCFKNGLEYFFTLVFSEG